MGIPVIVGGDVTRCQAISDIIESVARGETALSHISNAHGEILQSLYQNYPVLEPNALKEINKSTQRTVDSITRLEMMLYSKLSLFSDNIDLLCDNYTPPTPLK